MSCTTQRINRYRTLTTLPNLSHYFSDPMIPELKTHELEENISMITPPPNSTPTPDPTDYWGPQLWFTLHNSSKHYPMYASPLYAERMKQFIISLPVIIPCESCREHAMIYIDNYREQLDIICSGRESLFNFFVDFHNYVNQRKGKKLYSYEEAWKLYK